MNRIDLEAVISNEQAIGAWTEKALSRKVVRPTAIDSETDTGFWIYGYPVKSRNAGRRATAFPRLYFVPKG